MKNLVLIFMLLTVFGFSKAWGWGSYGHQQISSAAMELNKSTTFGQCLQNNREFMIRLAITPDADWKMGGTDGSALNIYNIVERLPKNPTDKNLLDKLNKLLAVEKAKTKKRILTDEFIAALGAKPADPELLQQLLEKEREAGQLGSMTEKILRRKQKADWDEHSVHFWEGDVYTAGGAEGIRKLPDDVRYDNSLAAYEAALAQSAEQLKKDDPCYETSKSPSYDVVQHGTAPWRVASLYEMGSDLLFKAAQHSKVEKLRKVGLAEFKLGLIVLGTMGHYVGDMGQPFHATRNFNGQQGNQMAAGIHSLYEEEMLEIYARKVNAKQDKASKLWIPTTFDATQQEVLASILPPEGQNLNLEAIPKDKIVSSIKNLVADGYPLVDPLVKLLEAARIAKDNRFQPKLVPAVCEAHKEKHPKTLKDHADTKDLFMNSIIEVEGYKGTVIQSAEKRMGQAALVLARLWEGAYAASKVSKEDLQALCIKENFVTDQVIDYYPAPAYHVPVTDFGKYLPRTTPEEDAKDNVKVDDGMDQGVDLVVPASREPSSVVEKKKKTKKKTPKAV